MMTRLSLAIGLLSTLLLAAPSQLRAQDADISKPVRLLVGEKYLYSIDFLFFKRLAEGELRLTETERPNVFQAELIGRTLGIASWLVGNRTQTYTSLMELTPDGSLRSIEHTGEIVKQRWGKWQNRGRRHRYDYEQGKVFAEKYREGVLQSLKEHGIPDGQQPVDMLTAFYNLRAGVYGPLVPGARFLIPTYSGKGFIDMEVNVLTDKEQAKQDYFPRGGLLVSAIIDPEIFDTDSGGLYFWFNDKGVPERGIVEDVIGLGDVRGYLEKEGL